MTSIRGSFPPQPGGPALGPAGRRDSRRVARLCGGRRRARDGDRERGRVAGRHCREPAAAWQCLCSVADRGRRRAGGNLPAAAGAGERRDGRAGLAERLPLSGRGAGDAGGALRRAGAAADGAPEGAGSPGRPLWDGMPGGGLSARRRCTIGASRWNKALLDNAARPSGALVYDPGGRVEPSTGPVQPAEGRAAARFSGSGNAGRPLLLEGGLEVAGAGLARRTWISLR